MKIRIFFTFEILIQLGWHKFEYNLVLADTTDQSIKIIRRSARWKKGVRGKRNSTSPDSAQSGSASPDLSNNSSGSLDLTKSSSGSLDTSKSSSSSPDPDCRIFCHGADSAGEQSSPGLLPFFLLLRHGGRPSSHNLWSRSSLSRLPSGLQGGKQQVSLSCMSNSSNSS